jgi:hypothetical protein
VATVTLEEAVATAQLHQQALVALALPQAAEVQLELAQAPLAEYP